MIVGLMAFTSYAATEVNEPLIELESVEKIEKLNNELIVNEVISQEITEVISLDECTITTTVTITIDQGLGGTTVIVITTTRPCFPNQ